MSEERLNMDNQNAAAMNVDRLHFIDIVDNIMIIIYKCVSHASSMAHLQLIQKNHILKYLNDY